MCTFTSSSETFELFNGPVAVLRPLTSQEADIDEVGPMFRCRGEYGLFDAFGDELEKAV